MTLTRLWSSLLALLATALLAGLYLLAAGSDEGFSDADKAAIEAVTNAGSAALHAEIESSPVTLGPSLLQDTRIQEALQRSAEGEVPEGELDLPQVLSEVANESLLADYPLMSVAFMDKNGQIVARTGMDEPLFDEVAALPDVSRIDGASRFSATLGGRLHAVQVSRKTSDGSGRRLVAIQAVNLGGNSLLRKVLGTNPAGLVRDGKVVGEPMGNASPDDLTQLIADNQDSIPPGEGASKVFSIGEGANQRIGAIARVPGPAGKGKNPTLLAVLSLNTLGVVDRDLASALKSAQQTNMDKVPWPIIGGFLLVALVLGWYLPHMEGVAPLRRLSGEFQGVVAGTQHQIFHDTYKGPVRDVARAAVNAQEAVRIAVEEEFAAAGVEPAYVPEDSEPAPKPAPKPKRRAADPPSAIELPGLAEEGPEANIESHSHDEGVLPPPSRTGDVPDDVEGLDAAGSALSADLGFNASAPPLNAPSDDAAGLLADEEPAAPADPREAYFREVYEEFVSLKQTCGEDTDNFPYEKFAKKLRKNTDTLLKRDGVADVKFNVYIKDGKAALKAKIVKA